MSRLHLLNRTVATALYCLEFLISILILAIFSYFLAVLTRRDDAIIPQWQKAVEGLSGAAALYCIFAVIFTCFLGGLTFFAFVAVVLNVLFCGAMVAIAIMTKAATKQCARTGDDSPIGVGNHLSCNLQKVAFAVSIIGAFLFLLSIGSQVLLSRSAKREKRYGPGPSNNYTSGSGKRRPWQRKKKTTAVDTELGATGTGVGAGTGAATLPHVNDTATHGNGTVANGVGYGGPNAKYAQATLPTQQHAHHNQTSGTVPASTQYTEMDAAPTTAFTGGRGHEHDKVNPYADVHGGAK